MYAKRITKLREIMKAQNISAYFTSKPADMRWLSGFTGSTAYILISENSASFITDGRYVTQSKQQLDPFWEILITANYAEKLISIAKKYSEITLSPKTHVLIYSQLVSSGIALKIDESNLMQIVRMLKEPDEIAEIKKEYELAGNAFLKSLSGWKYGQSENQWAALLEYNMKQTGAIGSSFETIIASGERGALPHGVASNKIIKQDESTTIDFGSAGFYNSDYTRIVYNGNDPNILKIIDIVRIALEKSLDAIKIGTKCADIYEIARNYIASCGYGEYFNHGLGHGVGVEVHEMPRISPSDTNFIQAGMVFTIEPGIYIPGKYGVRLEQTVAINSSGCDLLSDVLNKYVYTLD